MVACSTLRRSYRDRLRHGLEPPRRFVLLDQSREVLARRLAARSDHFMPASRLDSQLAILEWATPDEHALRFNGDAPSAVAVRAANCLCSGV